MLELGVAVPAYNLSTEGAGRKAGHSSLRSLGLCQASRAPFVTITLMQTTFLKKVGRRAVFSHTYESSLNPQGWSIFLTQATYTHVETRFYFPDRQTLCAQIK